MRRLLTVDDHLRLVLFGLECVLQLNFDAKESERMFDDSRRGGTGEKRYTFHRSGPEVSGFVEEHEPESVWLEAKSTSVREAQFDAIIENAKYHLFRWRRAE